MCYYTYKLMKKNTFNYKHSCFEVTIECALQNTTHFSLIFNFYRDPVSLDLLFINMLKCIWIPNLK